MKETFETYYQKHNSTNFDLQCEDECLECFSSEHSEEPQEGMSEDDESIVLIGAFDEEEDDLEHLEML